MAINTIKFSEFANGGNLENSDTTVGLRTGENTYFNNPWTFLPPGTTAERPDILDPTNWQRLRFNTTIDSYEYYDPVNDVWQQLEDSGDIEQILQLLASHMVNEGASLIGIQNQSNVTDKTVQDFANAPFIAKTDNGTLENAQFLGELTTGILKNTTTTGVLSISPSLTSIDALTTVANEMIYTTAPNTYALTALTAAARDFLALSSVANMVTFLGVLPLSGGTMAGNISMNDAYRVTNALDPVNPQDYATKSYVDGGAGNLEWFTVTTTPIQMAPDCGYIVNSASQIELILPEECEVGRQISIRSINIGGWKIIQNASPLQQIIIGEFSSAPGASGYLQSGTSTDTVDLTCVVEDTEFQLYAQQSSGVLLGTFIPSNISDLTVWLDATLVGPGSVSSWTDLSGGGDNATQSTPANQPQSGIANINGRNAISFNGTTQYFVFGSTSFLNFPFTIAIVAYANTTTLGALLSRQTGTTNGGVITSASTTWNFSVIDAASPYPSVTQPLVTLTPVIFIGTCLGNGDPLTSYLSSGSGSTSVDNLAGYANDGGLNGYLGNDPSSNFFNGAIGEVIIYGKVLNPAEFSELNTYLSAKWGIPLS